MNKASYNTKIRRFRMKREAVRLKGGKCVKCNWNGNIAAFHFHHTDPTKKEFGLSNAITTNWEKYLAELEKCELLCSNCHMIHHADNNSIQFLKDVEEYKGRELITSDIPWKNGTHIPNIKKYTHICPECKLEFKTSTYQQKFCSYKCRNKNKQKCERPSKAELINLISKTPITKIGLQFGVSDNAIRKWCKSYNIKL